MEFERAQRNIIAGLTRQELPVEVGADLLFSNVRVNVEGDDAGGYRVQLRAAGETQSFYVVREDGAYRILTVAPMMAPVALMALERIEAGDFAGARRWLDWARLELKPSNSEDPLEGPAFARAWTVGVEADLPRARLATALLLADCALGERALPLLLARARCGNQRRRPAEPRSRAGQGVSGTRVAGRSCGKSRARLVAAVPTSALAFRYQQWAGIQLQQWDAVEKASRERLARLPDDSIAREMLVHRAEARGTFGEIPVIMQPLIDSGRATASDYNQYAWTSLLTQPVSERGRRGGAHGLRRDPGAQRRHQSHAGLRVRRQRQAARGARPVAEGHGTGGHRQARRLDVVRLRPGGRGVWRRRVRARLLRARAEAEEGRDPGEQRVCAVAGAARGLDSQELEVRRLPGPDLPNSG